MRFIGEIEMGIIFAIIMCLLEVGGAIYHYSEKDFSQAHDNLTWALLFLALLVVSIIIK